ncbi:hypothetical protein Atc_1042 [Acidithiobacillus caldus SM-1]|uniref:Uncharacterized protein n=1 Tax=Acidithiobacillus caldus (strain SM-1) TaxID=990288 RepID=F9ZLA5_ACICS|nr:hypothetical protein Atc_1042 [Acidithiobacillus caldus SM-1]
MRHPALLSIGAIIDSFLCLVSKEIVFSL